MFELTVEVELSAAHHIPGHAGRCAQLHGHNYRVAVTVHSQQLNDQGMVMDFAELKELCRSAVDPLDHTLLNEAPALSGLNPTAEVLARHIYQSVASKLLATGRGAVQPGAVTVWESDRSYATYRE